jgi:uncharacterized protein (DUF2267 family)
MTISKLAHLQPVAPTRDAARRASVAATSAEALAFYQAVQQSANLATMADARRWNNAILRTLGELLSRPVRRTLAFALPPELAAALLEAPDPLFALHGQLPLERFLRTAALRSGATEAAAARRPVRTTFHLLKALLAPEVGGRVAGALPAEVAAFWEEAQPLAV